MMDGEKERERERGEEKESDETEEDAEGAALLWQEGSSDDDLGLPIMHWEALSLRIAQLEKQEEERREKNKVRVMKIMQFNGIQHVGRYTVQYTYSMYKVCEMTTKIGGCQLGKNIIL